MAMDNSAALPSDVTKETSSAIKEDLAFFDAGKGQKSEDDAAQDRNEDSEKTNDAADPEGVFVDAENAADDVNSASQGVVDTNSLDLRKASEDAEGEEVMEDENGSVESYDSALERIAVASTGDPASPEVPSSPVFQPAETPQQIALRQLNLWHSGISSFDSTLLENVSSAELRTRVAQIAQSQGLSSDSEDVEHVFSALLPLVEAKESKNVQDEVEADSKGVNYVSAGDESKDGEDNFDESRQEISSSKAESKVDDGGDNVDESRQEVSSTSKPESKVDDGGENVEESTKDIASSHPEANGNIEAKQSDMSDTQPVESLQGEQVDNSDLINEALTTSPDTISERSPPEDSLEENATNLDVGSAEDSTGDGVSETQNTKNESYEPEPEVIEWDDLNESDAEDLGNSNAEDPSAENILSKETVDLDSVIAGSQQKNENQDEFQSSVVKGEDKDADLLPFDAVVDRSEEQKEERLGLDEASNTVVPEEEPAALGSNAQAEFEPDDKPVETKEVSGNFTMDSSGAAGKDKEASGDDAGTKLEADERPSSDTVAGREYVKAAPKDLGADDGKAEASKPGSVDSEEQVNTRADDLKGFEEGTSKSTTVDTTEVNEGNGIEEPPAAGTSKLEDNETLEREVSPEKNDLVKEDDTPRLDNAMDASVNGAPAAATATVSVEEKNKESPPVNVSVKGEDSEKDIPSPAKTKVSTASANDSASSLGVSGPTLPLRPAGLGRSVPSLEHAPRAVQRTGGASASTRQATESNEENQSSTDVAEGSEDAREKLQMIRVKFLRLAHRLGQSAHNVVVAQVLYRLGLAEQLRGGRGSGRSGPFSFERASVLAEEQEAAGADDLEFGCTIMVLGKSGVGKSATINSLFDEIKSGTNAYSPATNKVQEIVGTVHGIKLRVIDTPGLLTSFTDQRRNERIMSLVKRFIKKSPPDIVLYFDRLDMQSRDYSDLPLLRTITDTFGSAVWFNAIVVLTHASSAPPDGANGVPVSYEMFVAQRSHVVQQTIRQAAGDMRLMNPVSLVENHAACRRNRAGERVLPNGQVWKPQLLLLCFASKILAEANSLLKLQDNTPAKPFGVRSRVPPLPFLLSSLLQSRAQLKLPDEQVGTDDDESEDESDDEAESEGEEEYDDLPPFRRLTRDELKLLDKEQRKTYAEELEYREKLFMKKQLKDERARKKELKRRLAALPQEAVQYVEENYEEENAAASVPVPMPDMALPPSFDSDNPTYRYRYLDAANQWLVRPVLETHGWDHDSGYDGLNVEKMFVVSKKIPVSLSGQVTKDKKEANLQMECAASFKNGEGKVTQAGLDIQTIGKDLAYTLRSETRFDNFKRNKTTCGLAVTLLGDTVAAGMKIEDRLLIGKRVKLVFNGGALTGRGDVAYGGSLEATIRDKDYPLGSFLSTFGLSVMDWHGDLAIGGNLQVQCKLGKTMTIVRGNLNNRRAGQVSIRVSSSEQLQIALIGLIPLLRTFINNRVLSSN